VTVCTLITANDPATYANCTLTLDTIRVGFPTAKIDVLINSRPFNFQETVRRAHEIGCRVISCRTDPEPIHHADWIRQRVLHASEAPTVIVDPDMIFWENCEGFTFPGSIAGAYVPDHWNHWSDCAYRSRLHTSFLWINDPKALLAAIPRGSEPYLPFDPFHPVTTFDFGRATFYDTLAILCHALPKKEVCLFGEEHMNCYDHINSASFYKQMLVKFEEPKRSEFARIHELARTNPKELRGLWRQTARYYAEQHIELIKRLPTTGWDADEAQKISRGLTR
jgi:hypothetical protein